MTREALLTALVALLRARHPPHPLRVAVDGPDAAGKTTLADELAARLRPHRPVPRVSGEGFHQPRARRLRRGPLSPEGHLEDSFDTAAVVAEVLGPLGAGGDRRYHPAVFDHLADVPAHPPVATARTTRRCSSTGCSCCARRCARSGT